MPKLVIPKGPAKPLDRWSYSSWSARKKCEYFFYIRFVLNVQEPPSDSRALERGIDLHKKQENYLKGEIPVLPKPFESFKEHYKQLKKRKPIVEKFWGVDKRWRPVNWQSWVVMKMDAALAPEKKTGDILWIQDLKTGQEHTEGHKSQGKLYAAIGRAIYPKTKGVIIEFWYTDQGYPVQYEYTLAQLKRAQEYWMEQGNRVLTPKKTYMPNPSIEACRWCFLRTDKGGPCDAWKVVPELFARRY